jgi:hypothetical protein
MMSRHLFIAGCIAVFSSMATGRDLTAREEKENEIRALVSRLQSLEGARPKDLELQLGLAVFYRDYYVSADYSERRDAQYARVLGIDPNNKVIWQMRADDAVGKALGAQEKTVHYLESQIENAQTYGRKQIYIAIGIYANDPNPNRPWSLLYNVLGDKSGRTVEIKEEDYDLARAKVRQYADNALNQGIKEVDECERHDAENAYYNYSRAELYFNLRQPALAVQELQAAVRKPFIQRYLDQKEKAVTRALEIAEAPAGLFSTSEHRTPAGDYVFTFIWQKYAEPLAAKMEAEGNLDEANEIYKLATGVAKQIREEQLPYDSPYNRGVGARLERWATERASALEKRMDGPAKPSDNTPASK